MGDITSEEGVDGIMVELSDGSIVPLADYNLIDISEHASSGPGLQPSSDHAPYRLQPSSGNVSSGLQPGSDPAQRFTLSDEVRAPYL